MKRLAPGLVFMLIFCTHPGLLWAQPLELDYSTYLGGSGNDYGNGISLGTDGRAYVTGYTISSDFPTENPYQAAWDSVSYDVFVTALSSTGSTLSYSTYLGGSDIDWAYGISVGTDGKAFVIGYTTSPDFPTKNPYQAGYGGMNDAFVTSLSSTGSTLPIPPTSGGATLNGRTESAWERTEGPISPGLPALPTSPRKTPTRRLAHMVTPL